MEVTKAEFARLIGVSGGRVTQLIKSGALTVNHRRKIETQSEKNAVFLRGRGIDPVSLSPLAGAQEPDAIPTDGDDTDDWKTRKLIAQTRKLELETRVKRRELIPTSDVKYVISRVWHYDQTGLYEIPHRISPELAAAVRGADSESTAEVILRARIDREIRAALEWSKGELARELEQMEVEDDES